jgi:transcriptional regulator
VYIPPAFAVTDPVEIAEMMRRFNFGLLVTVGPDGAPFASHLPFLYEPRDGGLGVVSAHMARANPQWRHFAGGAKALCVFWGPHAYLSPRWYETKGMVPTWNYATVHVTGAVRIVDDLPTLRAQMDRLVEANESGLPTPWSSEELPAGVFDGLSRGIVGFEVEIATVEAKAKMSQNRKAQDALGAIAALEAQGGDDALATAAWMRRATQSQV